MIVRIHFEGVVKHEKIRSIVKDYVDIHAGETKEAKEIFLSWIAKSMGIKGNSGIFHPLAGLGDIKIKSMENIPSKKSVISPEIEED